MMIWIVSLDKAGIRNPLPRRLVLCAFEVGELMILSSDYHNPAGKNSVFFAYLMTFFALLQEVSCLLMPYASPSPTSLWKGFFGYSEGKAWKRLPRRSGQPQALHSTRPSHRKNAAGAKPSGSAESLFGEVQCKERSSPGQAPERNSGYRSGYQRRTFRTGRPAKPFLPGR